MTNSPRASGELMISSLGLTDFFEILVIGNECDRAKPFPDPYLKALETLKVSQEHTFIFEVWHFGSQNYTHCINDNIR